MDKNIAPCGSFVGAIFMSNHATRSECFQRRIFGLPVAQASYVKQVKMGMMLFLFQNEERKLYGVFEATSDGGINIEPHAFSSSGRSFAAQIRFKVIWKCRPLFEHEFCEAIRDNYYSPNRFYFSLSDEQVHKLLLLFDERRSTKIFRSFSLGRGNRVMKQPENHDLSNLQVTVTNHRVENEPDMFIKEKRVNLSRYSDSSMHNPSLSGHHNKPTWSRAGQQGLSSASPCASMPPMPDVMPLTSNRDGSLVGNHHVNPLHDSQGCSRSFSFPPVQSDFSSGDDHDNSAQEKELAYSKNPANGPFPLSRKCFFPAHMGSYALNSSSTADYLSLDVPVDGDGFGPLSYFDPSSDSIPSLGARYFEKRLMKPTSFEGYEGLPLPDNYDRPAFACSPCKDPPQLHDRTILHEDGYEGECDHSYKPSTVAVSLPEAKRPRMRITDPSCFSDSPRKGISYMHEHKHPLEIQYEDGCRERISHRHVGHQDENYGNVVKPSLHSDTFNKKISVFSRLSVQDNQILEAGAYASVDELMEKLHRRTKCWRKIRDFTPWNVWKNNESPESVVHMENQMSDVNASDGDDLGDNGEESQEIPGIPFLNFRRRSEVHKAGGETERRDHGEAGKQKRRKLIRPSFSEEEPFDRSSGKCLNKEGPPSQELRKGNADKSRAAVDTNTEEGRDDRQNDFSEAGLENSVSSSIIGIKEDDTKVESSRSHAEEDGDLEGLLQGEVSTFHESTKNFDVQETSFELNIYQKSAKNMSEEGLLSEEAGNKNANFPVGDGEDQASGNKAKRSPSEVISNDNAIPAVNNDDQALAGNIVADRYAAVGDQNTTLLVYHGKAEGKSLEDKSSVEKVNGPVLEVLSNENISLAVSNDDHPSVTQAEGDGDTVGNCSMNLPDTLGEFESEDYIPLYL